MMRASATAAGALIREATRIWLRVVQVQLCGTSQPFHQYLGDTTLKVSQVDPFADPVRVEQGVVVHGQPKHLVHMCVCQVDQLCSVHTYGT